MILKSEIKKLKEQLLQKDKCLEVKNDLIQNYIDHKIDNLSLKKEIGELKTKLKKYEGKLNENFKLNENLQKKLDELNQKKNKNHDLQKELDKVKSQLELKNNKIKEFRITFLRKREFDFEDIKESDDFCYIDDIKTMVLNDMAEWDSDICYFLRKIKDLENENRSYLKIYSNLIKKMWNFTESIKKLKLSKKKLKYVLTKGKLRQVFLIQSLISLVKLVNTQMLETDEQLGKSQVNILIDKIENIFFNLSDWDK